MMSHPAPSMKRLPKENGAWKKYVAKEGALWTNPDMLQCTFVSQVGPNAFPCGFVDSDAENISIHYIIKHGPFPIGATPDGLHTEAESATEQTKMTGGLLSREDKMAEILRSLDVEDFQCAFCLGKMKSTGTRLFNEGGQLLKLVKCLDCGSRMEIDSMRITRNPKAYGIWAGEYRGFWFKVKPDRDAFMAKMSVSMQSAARAQFWDGYGIGNPKWAERKRVEAAGGNVEVAKARQEKQEKDELDEELAKYKKPDGSIDWEKLSKDAAENLQKKL